MKDNRFSIPVPDGYVIYCGIFTVNKYANSFLPMCYGLILTEPNWIVRCLIFRAGPAGSEVFEC